MQTNATTTQPTFDPSSQTHLRKDSKGNFYLWQFMHKHSTFDPNLKLSCFTIRRWDPTTNSPIPRIRTSKKLRLKLKRLLCSAASSNSTAAPALSTSLA